MCMCVCAGGGQRRASQPAASRTATRTLRALRPGPYHRRTRPSHTAPPPMPATPPPPHPQTTASPTCCCPSCLTASTWWSGRASPSRTRERAAAGSRSWCRCCCQHPRARVLLATPPFPSRPPTHRIRFTCPLPPFPCPSLPPSPLIHSLTRSPTPSPPPLPLPRSCKPLLIATYNPEEGPLREHLLDRIAMTLSADVAWTFQDRVNAVEQATRFQDFPTDVLSDVEETTDGLRTQVRRGRAGGAGRAGERLRRRRAIFKAMLAAAAALLDWPCLLAPNRPHLLPFPRFPRLTPAPPHPLSRPPRPPLPRLCLRGSIWRRCPSASARCGTWLRRRGAAACRATARSCLGCGWPRPARRWRGGTRWSPRTCRRRCSWSSCRGPPSWTCRRQRM